MGFCRTLLDIDRMYLIGEVRPPPYAHLALRPRVTRVWAHCGSTCQEVSDAALQQSHICIHTYIHVDGAWCVCGALPYSLEWTSRPQIDHPSRECV